MRLVVIVVLIALFGLTYRAGENHGIKVGVFAGYLAGYKAGYTKAQQTSVFQKDKRKSNIV